MNTLRRWSRNIHRELSFFFAGILIIYAISGIVMNHRNSINLNYSIERKEYRVQVPLPSQEEMCFLYLNQSVKKWITLNIIFHEKV